MSSIPVHNSGDVIVNKSRPRVKRRSVLSRLLQNKIALIALIFLLLVHLMVFLGPIFWTISPEKINPAATLAPWTAQHPLGTDDLGRDVLSRMLHGGRITLLVGFTAMVVTILVGGIVGAFAGYFGRWIEAILMRVTEALMAIPNFFLALVALTVLGKSPVMIVLVIAFTSWMEIARVVYGETMKWKAQEFVEASVASGATHLRTLFAHVIPQVIPTIIVSCTLGIAWSILTESAISYLGLGIQPPTPTWGNMLQNAQQYIWTAPVLGVLPGLAITLVVLAYNFLGDGLRDALDPKHIKK
ncbi:ABC transporter permease [Bacillus sp. B-jedd]|uniref:ABC transporter permease n=1 Tax=Bacillus sp. B-jedd TaxID=1476857 RepID=UPI0009E32520|nr:ABC transporter permease [Bacillus sp. B-jedd]